MAGLDAQFFLKLGLEVVHRDPDGSCKTAYRRFAAFYSVRPETCAVLWQLWPKPQPNGFLPKHVLWGILFLARYETEECNAALVGVDEKTFRLCNVTLLKRFLNLCGMFFVFLFVTNNLDFLGITASRRASIEMLCNCGWDRLSHPGAYTI